MRLRIEYSIEEQWRYFTVSFGFERDKIIDAGGQLKVYLQYIVLIIQFP